eukprot:scaffold69144_cov69-Phaeocystis_antarctica.AAC.3
MPGRPATSAVDSSAAATASCVGLALRVRSTVLLAYRHPPQVIPTTSLGTPLGPYSAHTAPAATRLPCRSRNPPCAARSGQAARTTLWEKQRSFSWHMTKPSSRSIDSAKRPTASKTNPGGPYAYTSSASP